MFLSIKKADVKSKNLQKGFGLVEAVTTSIFVVVAVVLSLDCWFMITAARVTDAACRDAARAAAQAGDATTANNAALAALQPYMGYGNSMMTAPTVTVTYNDSATPPSVTVVTSMSVTPLIPLSVLGSSVNGMNFTQQYSFPIVRTMNGVTAQNVTNPGASGGTTTGGTTTGGTTTGGTTTGGTTTGGTTTGGTTTGGTTTGTSTNGSGNPGDTTSGSGNPGDTTTTSSSGMPGGSSGSGGPQIQRTEPFAVAKDLVVTNPRQSVFHVACTLQQLHQNMPA